MLFRFYSKDRIYDTSSNLKWISLFSFWTIKRFFSVSLFKLNVNSISLSVIFMIFEFSFNVVPRSLLLINLDRTYHIRHYHLACACGVIPRNAHKTARYIHKAVQKHASVVKVACGFPAITSSANGVVALLFARF